ncbi:MAG: serine hydrolase [Actinomycetota bacterium]
MALPLPIDVPTPPFPPQDKETAWPTSSWPIGPVPEGLDLEALLDQAFDPEGPCSTTNAVVVIHKGRLIAERYAGNREFFDRAPEPIDAASSLISWSMAKSMLQVLTFSLVAEGVFDLNAPLGIPEWSTPGDPRGDITLAELLAMRDGLNFIEDYVDGESSDVIEMLFGSGKADVAHFAADRPLAHEPGTFYNYSSGTTNIISGAIARHFGGGEAYKGELNKRLFEPLSMQTADPGFDDAGTFVGSSYVHATAQDFARFGLCLLRGGVFNGQQVIPPAAVAAARTPLSRDPDGLLYSMQFWMPGDAHGTFAAQGYEGQSITVCPALDVVLVRLGRTPSERFQALLDWRWSVLDAFAQLEK